MNSRLNKEEECLIISYLAVLLATPQLKVMHCAVYVYLKWWLPRSRFLILVFPPSVPPFHVSIRLFNLHFFYPECTNKWDSQPQISSYERGHADGNGHVTLLATARPPLHHSLDALPGFSAQWCSRTVSRCRTKMHYRSALRHRRRTDDQPGPRWAAEGWGESEEEEGVAERWGRRRGQLAAGANESKVKAPLVWQLRACTLGLRVIDAAVHFFFTTLLLMFESGSGTTLCGKDRFILRYLICDAQAASTCDTNCGCWRASMWVCSGEEEALFFTSEWFHSTKLMF